MTTDNVVFSHLHTRLDFTWGWLSGAEGGGESSYIEMPAQ